MSKRLYILGMGPGAEGLISPAVRVIAQESDILIGGRRNLEPFAHLGKETLVIGNNLEEVCAYIRENIGSKKIAVLATGDPGLYGITEYLKGKLAGIELEVVPGISSLQYLCSKLKLSWNDVYITSVHGREQPNLGAVVREHGKVAVFTGGGCTADSVCRRLVEMGLGQVKVAIGENLSYPNERLVCGKPEELGGMSFESLSIMIIENEYRDSGVWNYATSGIPDEMFIRGDVPMTKEEVRTVAVSKLRLANDSIVYDIGAGTGSITIECGLRCSSGRVIAVEKNEEAVGLIGKNVQKFGLHNVDVIEAEAPNLPDNFPEPDRVFIGGTSGSMEGVLSWISGFNKAVRVVVNTVTIESTYEAVQGLEKLGFGELEIVNLSVSRGRSVGGKHLMQAQNPVYIISAEKAK